jgi:hypothetical protein
MEYHYGGWNNIIKGVRCMKKIVAILSLLVLLISNSVSLAASTDVPVPLDKEEFLKVVEKSDLYKEYKDSLLTKDPLLVNPLRDAEEQQYGWIVQYEVKYNVEKAKETEAQVNFTSVLSFFYDNKTNELKSFLIDYSRLLEDKAYYVIDLYGKDPEQKIDVSDDPLFIDYLKEVEDKKQKRIKEAKEQKEKDGESEAQIGYTCWQCSKTETYGGDYSGKCAAAVGGACYLAGSHWAVRLTCAAMTVIGCYVPKYTICVAGKWVNSCPIAA